MSLALEISNISYSYSQDSVLQDISLNLLSQESLGFVGLNGAGKTTLIKIIIDLLQQDSGSVKIFSQDKNIPESRQNLCYLPEKFQPANNLTGLEFIKFALKFYQQNIDNSELENICQKLDFPIDKIKNRVTSYSKGMVQKIGLISVFLSKAKLLILDEPMSGLDPKARIKLKNQILSYKEQGNSIFFTSHILSDLEDICDKIAILNDKKLRFHGLIQDFLQKHQENNIESAFLKEINI